jgi:predicted DNA-binding transcriptional regulator AlpA
MFNIHTMSYWLGGAGMVTEGGIEGARAINESELARLANISTAVLRKWRREGKGPRFVKLGRLVRYLVRDVNTWLDDQAVGTDNKGRIASGR